jgi:quercetin dioxygenase-like cupin family protein
MKIFTLRDMKGGWFIGDFEPSCCRATAFEVGSKQYRKGDSEPEHVHRIATEVTLILSGRAAMNGRELNNGDIVLLEPGEPASFDALEDTVTVVIKFPSVTNDKYLTRNN